MTGSSNPEKSGLSSSSSSVKSFSPDDITGTTRFPAVLGIKAPREEDPLRFVPNRGPA
jgi:hypothetical protein